MPEMYNKNTMEYLKCDFIFNYIYKMIIFTYNFIYFFVQ